MNTAERGQGISRRTLLIGGAGALGGAAALVLGLRQVEHSLRAKPSPTPMQSPTELPPISRSIQPDHDILLQSQVQADAFFPEMRDYDPRQMIEVNLPSSPRTTQFRIDVVNYTEAHINEAIFEEYALFLWNLRDTAMPIFEDGHEADLDYFSEAMQKRILISFRNEDQPEQQVESVAAFFDRNFPRKFSIDLVDRPHTEYERLEAIAENTLSIAAVTSVASREFQSRNKQDNVDMNLAVVARTLGFEYDEYREYKPRELRRIVIQDFYDMIPSLSGLVELKIGGTNA